MKNLIVCIYFVPALLWGQNGFMKKYERESYGNYLSSDLRSILQQDQSLYLFGTVNNGSAKQIYHDFFTKIDQNGEIINVSIDSSLSFVSINTALFKNDFFYTAGYKITSGQIGYKTKIIRKVDINGDIIWTKTFGDSASHSFDNSVHKIFSRENNLIVFGTSNLNDLATASDFSLLNNEGEIIVFKQYSISDSLDYLNHPFSSIQTQDGYILLIKGEFGPVPTYVPYELLKLDNFGGEIFRIQLNKFTLPEREEIDSMQTASGVFNMRNNHFGVAFDLFKLDENGEFLKANKKILAEFDENGNYIRSKEILKGLVFNAMKIQSNENGEIFIFGSYTDPVNLADLFVVKLDENFNVLWHKNYGYEGVEMFSDADLTNDGGVVLLGSKLRYSYPAGRDYFIIKTDCMGNTEWDNTSCFRPSDKEVNVLGNPVTSVLTVQFPNNSDDEMIDYQIVDALGKIIQQGTQYGKILNVDVSQIATGMYYLQSSSLEQADKQHLKFLKQ